MQDIRYALRWLRRSPGFAAVAILSIGLGVGVNAAMFSVVDALLFRPLPVQAPDELVDVFTSSSDGDEYATSSYADFLDLKAQNGVFSDMTGYSPMFAPLALGDRSRLVLGQIVTSNHFALLGIPPALGRLLVPADDEPSSPRVVVLSYRTWQREFGGRADIVGQEITLRGLSYAVVGVAPASFNGVIPLLEPELWLPVAHAAEVDPAGINSSVPSPTGRTILERRGQRWLFIKGRLKPGVTAEQARANIALIGTQLASEHQPTNRNARMSAVPTSEVRMLVPQAGGVLSLGATAVMSVVALVLLIASANVAGMLLARASARRREISVRLAIGASRSRLIRQLLIEGMVIGGLGVIVAVAAAWVVVRALLAIELPLPVQVGFDLRLDGRVLAFSVIAATTAGLLASLLPALQASAPDLVPALKGEAAISRGPAGRWTLRDTLAAGQMALTVVLLVVAGLLLRSLSASQRADVGFNPEGVAVLSFDTDMVRYPTERGVQFWTDTLARVRAMPGVVSAATASPTTPFEFNFNTSTYHVDVRSYPDTSRGEVIENRAVSPGYFETLGIRLIEGRDFQESDQPGAPPVAIVNRTMAQTFWPGTSAVGHTVRNPATGTAYEIVGVVADHKNHGVLESAAPFIHFASAQSPRRYNTLVARASGDPSPLLAAMRRELLQQEPGLVFMANSTMEDNMAAMLVPARVGATLAAAFGGLATLLAAIGLYGVIAFSVARRTREIGIRMAVGASARDVLTLVLRQGLVLALVGLAVGAVLGGAAASALSGLLYGITPFDPAAWGLAVLTLLVAAGLANLVPARRAMRVQPMVALRTE